MNAKKAKKLRRAYRVRAEELLEGEAGELFKELYYACRRWKIIAAVVSAVSIAVITIILNVR